MNAASWNREVLVDVGAQRFQRRDVDDASLVRQRRAKALLKQLVDSGKERGERLAGSGGRGNQRVPSRLNLSPAALLCSGRRTQRLFEPACCDVMKMKNAPSLPDGRSRRGAEVAEMFSKKDSAVSAPPRLCS